MLSFPGTWIVSSLEEGTDQAHANCLLYLCRDREYHMDSLSKNSRKAIRRGLRQAKIRRCTWDELAEKGYPALAETDQRHGYKAPPQKQHEQFVRLRRERPFYEAWGAWIGDDLVSWLVLIKIDKWVFFEASPSRDKATRVFASNALRYQALRSLLVEEGYQEVLTGLSSISPNTDPRHIWKFNTRLGFEGLPYRRVFFPSPLLRMILKPKAAALMWQTLSQVFPQFSILHKAAGLSGLISGRTKSPLAWVETADEDIRRQQQRGEP